MDGGWRYVWHLDTDPRNEFHFECTECLYKHIFQRRGVLERFGPMFCHADIINYGSLTYTDFIRTQTLCQGGAMCDFRFVRHRKGEQWQRSRSVLRWMTMTEMIIELFVVFPLFFDCAVIYHIGEDAA